MAGPGRRVVKSAPHLSPKGKFARRAADVCEGVGSPSNFAPWTRPRLTFTGVKCPYCRRPVKLINLRRSNPVKWVLPRCGACHRYVLSWPHKLALTLLALAAFGPSLSDLLDPAAVAGRDGAVEEGRGGTPERGRRGRGCSGGVGGDRDGGCGRR